MFKFREDRLPDLDSVILHANQSDIRVISQGTLDVEGVFTPNDNPGPGIGPISDIAYSSLPSQKPRDSSRGF